MSQARRNEYCWFSRHDAHRGLDSRALKALLVGLITAIAALAQAMDSAASPETAVAASSALDFKQWGLLAIQDGGRRKPVDTFAKESPIRVPETR
jgi:hypothetical protein